jgi:hypothetical protein
MRPLAIHPIWMVVTLAVAMVAGTSIDALATTPDPNSAVIKTRVFNDCPSSVLVTNNSYPALISVSDANLSCGGFANLHNWRFSVDGASPVDFDNGSAFTYCATLVISGTAHGEAGLQICPWWSQDVDGRLNVRTTDGEIACFGGRLPFYSFTGSHGLHYVKGTPILLQITYHPGSLSMANPGTIIYDVTYDAINYSSGPLPFDKGNPAEGIPHGLWGILNEARVGGHVQAFLQAGNPAANLTAEWRDICYTNNDDPIPVEPTTWGKVKSIYSAN